ncbi:MAG: fructose-6-phosphate aldolase [Candidatus Bipolaricaulota bacterium]|nr:fructose-6-phosphate aldolase [Candidatus Bipolaricaulota bacterium]MCS7274379.1 fructose-6-phosphate aldolase [Candidatus Bipolaricaulota bacterium]MDW8111556.1 fructose-6-phosphate aldolase [Candidatus Bipolaricaulota bacterium]MDW8329985.1 fructose-6-phosphate aldolase [Candidatus Bipolaricaulota bacterium]
MKFFLDTANVKEIAQAHEMGVLDGVTTNPTLLSKEGRDPVQVMKEICAIVDGPVNAEVISTDYEGMLREAHRWAELDEKIVVKIPMTREGMKAVRRLSEEGIPTNVTLVFSPSQALIAAKAGADYVSPFVGRLDDRSEDGMELVSNIIQIFDNYGFETEVIVASIRHPMHVVEAALAGADIATMPYAVFERLFEHPLTDLGLAQFLKDWEKLKR